MKRKGEKNNMELEREIKGQNMNQLFAQFLYTYQANYTIYVLLVPPWNHANSKRQMLYKNCKMFGAIF